MDGVTVGRSLQQDYQKNQRAFDSEYECSSICGICGIHAEMLKPGGRS